MNSVRHHEQHPLSLISSARSCRRTRGRLRVAPEVSFKARLLEAEKGVGHRHQAEVMMPAQPLAALVMAHLQFPFQFAIVLFDPPAGFGDANETPQPERLGTELSQPALGRPLFAFGPFHQQRLPDAPRVGVFTPPVGRPDLRHGKARRLGSPVALEPRHATPSRARQRLSHLLQALRPRQRLGRGDTFAAAPSSFFFGAGTGRFGSSLQTAVVGSTCTAY